MKEKIHPRYIEATITCSCGNSWKTRSTRESVHLDVCSNCHPYFTGEQRIVDTAGRVERFMKRYGLQEKKA
jgi:large subunit ribosomal protein L31